MSIICLRPAIVKQFCLTHRGDPNRYYHPGSKGFRSNGNEGILYIPQNRQAVASPSGSLVSYPGDSLRVGGLTPLLMCSRYIVTYSYADGCRNIFNAIKTNGHSSLEKYTSHFIWECSKGLRKVLSVRGELETEQTLTLLTIAAFLSRSPELLNWGPGGPASAGTWFSFQHLLSNWSELLVAGVI